MPIETTHLQSDARNIEAQWKERMQVVDALESELDN